MDASFRGKGLWIGLAALGVIMLCLLLAGMGMVAMLMPRPAPVYVQPPAGGESLAPPAAPGYTYPSFHSPMWMPFAGVGLIFRLFFMGLLALLFLGLARRFMCGPRRWGPPHGPGGGWHHHRHPWAPAEPGQTPGETPGAGYSGPQE